MFHVIFNNPKFSVNVGSLVRSVDIFGAKRVIVANNSRVENLNHCSDTAKVFKKRGEVYNSLQDALNTFDSNVKIIGIELCEGSENLINFEHPEEAVYIFGSEDTGLSKEDMSLCDYIVQIPSDKSWSLNISQASGIIAYDRFAKSSCN